jgi:hypothetical protein
VRALLLTYFAGVAIGLWRADGSAAARTVVALLWPVGLLAAVVTASILTVAAMVLFPWLGVSALAGAGVLWWLVA